VGGVRLGQTEEVATPVFFVEWIIDFIDEIGVGVGVRQPAGVALGAASVWAGRLPALFCTGIDPVIYTISSDMAGEKEVVLVAGGVVNYSSGGVLVVWKKGRGFGAVGVCRVLVLVVLLYFGDVVGSIKLAAVGKVALGIGIGGRGGDGVGG
jgi:hypothetical protein